MDVGVVVVVVVLQRLEHLAGLLAGGGVIEVDQGLAQAGLLRQQGEVLAGLGRQIHRGKVHQAGGAAHADSSSNWSRGHHWRAGSGRVRRTSSQKARFSRPAACSAPMPRLWR